MEFICGLTVSNTKADGKRIKNTAKEFFAGWTAHENTKEIFMKTSGMDKELTSGNSGLNHTEDSGATV